MNAVIAFEHVNSKGRKYYLHSKEVALRNGKRRIYYFARTVKHPYASTMPKGMKVVEGRNGLPLLKKV